MVRASQSLTQLPFGGKLLSEATKHEPNISQQGEQQDSTLVSPKPWEQRHAY